MNEQTGYYSSPAGILLIKATHVLTSISFVDGNIPPDTKQPAGMIKECIRELNDYFNGTGTSFSVPVTRTGTDFQQRVWSELLKIPFGETISYLELAKRLGDEKCIRAAASANGKNPLAVIVPCHRVIGSDGSLTGYAGGVMRKQWLLDHEQKVSGKFPKLF